MEDTFKEDRKIRIIKRLWEEKVQDIKSVRSLIKRDIKSYEISQDEVIVTLMDNRKFSWNINDFYSLEKLVIDGTWEKEETIFLKNLIKPGDIIFDIGANFGWYTTLFSIMTGTQGEVHSFEPLPSTFEELSLNVRVNSMNNVNLNRAALSNYNGYGNIFCNSNKGKLLASLKEEIDSSGSYSHECEVITLDSYCYNNNIHNISLIKMDIEGAELLALYGSNKVLSDFNSILMIEVVPKFTKKFNYEPYEIFRYLSEFGYEFFYLQNGALCKIMSADSLSEKIYNIFCIKNKSSII
ncbi:FkbM family methyltransferase [Rossellomorea vietnamensis]|uniref:FkbM family methyltransferase n=1 Tax=Rossellomorea vietnamensis TaxID=218284 RepID=A0A6I6UE63_9BACI|nr:FkbM family methyltransferase [Rossellomorea vietnamensis]QHE59817.1 FkbM family methyltransferase [Rossellomorea vietnamensis]